MRSGRFGGLSEANVSRTQLEIELKARVPDPAALAARLEARCGPCIEVHKLDEYRCEPGADPATCSQSTARIVRLRRSNDQVELTTKSKTIEDGVEVSRETELEIQGEAVESLAAARDFLDAIGYQVYLRKEKRSRVFRDAEPGGLSFELNTVTGLGVFLEIEDLVDSEASPATIRAARERIRGELERLGLGEQDIEVRSYTQMLREAGIAGGVEVADAHTRGTQGTDGRNDREGQGE